MFLTVGKMRTTEASVENKAVIAAVQTPGTKSKRMDGSCFLIVHWGRLRCVLFGIDDIDGVVE